MSDINIHFVQQIIWFLTNFSITLHDLGDSLTPLVGIRIRYRAGRREAGWGGRGWRLRLLFVSIMETWCLRRLNAFHPSSMAVPFIVRLCLTLGKYIYSTWHYCITYFNYYLASFFDINIHQTHRLNWITPQPKVMVVKTKDFPSYYYDTPKFIFNDNAALFWSAGWKKVATLLSLLM